MCYFTSTCYACPRHWVLRIYIPEDVALAWGIGEVWSSLGFEDEYRAAQDNVSKEVSSNLARLLAETVHLGDLSNVELLDLQSEVQQLRLPSLLRLHTLLHVPFDGRSSAHAAFLARLDILVYEMLGEKALQSLEAP
eukprot:4011870-Amphidinium_carterae.1